MNAERSVNMARDLANTPANDLYPETIARKARSFAKTYGFSAKALGVPELKKLKMNAILAACGLLVGAGLLTVFRGLVYSYSLL